MQIPTLETDRLRLRPFHARDADRYYEILYSDPLVMKTLPGGVPRPREAVDRAFEVFREHWKMDGVGLWAVDLKETDELIGHGGLLRFLADDQHEIEVAYGLGHAYWGKGYATEIARQSLRFGFEDVGVKQILAVAVPENKNSFKVMEKCGMRFWKNVNSYNLTLPCYRITYSEFEASQQNGDPA